MCVVGHYRINTQLIIGWSADGVSSAPARSAGSHAPILLPRFGGAASRIRPPNAPGDHCHCDCRNASRAVTCPRADYSASEGCAIGRREEENLTRLRVQKLIWACVVRFDKAPVAKRPTTHRADGEVWLALRAAPRPFTHVAFRPAPPFKVRRCNVWRLWHSTRLAPPSIGAWGWGGAYEGRVLKVGHLHSSAGSPTSTKRRGLRLSSLPSTITNCRC